MGSSLRSTQADRKLFSRSWTALSQGRYLPFMHDMRATQKTAGLDGFVKFMDIPPGTRILDFGCGDGRGVCALVSMGYDAWGADIADLWSVEAVAERLRTIPTAPYRLPFDDSTFDFVLSEQVMEHVFDYKTTFAEIRRVLKPGGLSVHRFPGPGGLVEGHTNVPLTWLCRYKAWLALWALLGRRRIGEANLDWRSALAASQSLIASAHYPRKSEIARHAEQTGFKVRFCEVSEFLWRDGGRLAPIILAARRLHADRIAAMAVSPLMQRYMILEG